MKIAIGIPSYNEADNIAFVVSQADKGLSLLKKIYPNFKDGIIVNIDGGSNDSTQEIFKRRPTSWPKSFIKTGDQPGKGKNLLAFFNLAEQEGFDAVVTVDADLKNIEPSWIVEFLKPIIVDNCDFVAPLYKRNRFEGSTTNHFAFPLIYSFFGLDVRQPIAGDFALSSRMVKTILAQKIPAEAERYGIDIFITITAALSGFSIYQISLDQKIHKPSFANLKIMFPQIASAAIEALRQGNVKISARAEKMADSICINDNLVFAHADKAEELVRQQKEYFESKKKEMLWLEGELKERIHSGMEKEDFYFDKELWAEVLSEWLLFCLNNRKEDSFSLGEQLLPFFVFRTVHFWKKIVGCRNDDVEKEIKEQAQLIREKLMNKCKK